MAPGVGVGVVMNRNIRFTDDNYSRLVEVAEAQGVALNALVNAVIGQYLNDNYALASQTFECGGCGKHIQVNDPVVQYKGIIYCNYAHALAFVTQDFWNKIHNFGYTELAHRLVGAQPDLAGSLRQRGHQARTPWLVTRKVNAELRIKGWDKAAPQICQGCNVPFGHLNQGDVYGASSYGSYHVGCLVPRNVIAKQLTTVVVGDWLSKLNAWVTSKDLGDTLVFDPATIAAGFWTGSEVEVV